MSYEFLRTYSIPTTSVNRAGATNQLGNWSSEEQQKIDSYPNQVYYEYIQPPSQTVGEQVPPVMEYSQYSNSNRFIPPGKQGTPYRPPQLRPQLKRKYKAGPGEKAEQIMEKTEDGKLTMFQGRDPSYPDELNALIHPISCELCNTQMNSVHSAKDHYQSKVHDRNLTIWLNKNYIEKGLSAPPIKRFLKQGKVGPEAFHCELCDLKLTSVLHANQHYSGRKHRLVAEKNSKPSGAGYYDDDGKWVRTGTKNSVLNDGRFGISEEFKQLPKVEKTDVIACTADTTSPTSSDVKILKTSPVVPKPQVLDKSLFCSICKVYATSMLQLSMHLEGSKHRKKLRLSGMQDVDASTSEAVGTTSNVATGSILASLSQKGDSSAELSMYRTPTGSYYCKTCNTSMCHITALEQHLQGKKHLKNLSEEKAKRVSSTTTTTTTTTDVKRN